MMFIMQAAEKLVSVRNLVGHMLWPAIVALVPRIQIGSDWRLLSSIPLWSF